MMIDLSPRWPFLRRHWAAEARPAKVKLSSGKVAKAKSGKRRAVPDDAAAAAHRSTEGAESLKASRALAAATVAGHREALAKARLSAATLPDFPLCRGEGGGLRLVLPDLGEMRGLELRLERGGVRWNEVMLREAPAPGLLARRRAVWHMEVWSKGLQRAGYDREAYFATIEGAFSRFVDTSERIYNLLPIAMFREFFVRVTQRGHTDALLLP